MENKLLAAAKRKQVLTSVKVDEIDFNDFKVACVKDKYTLTKLVQSSMKLYLTDEKFKNFMLMYLDANT